MTALMSRIETHGDRIKYAPLGRVAFSQETREISSKLIFIRDLHLCFFVNVHMAQSDRNRFLALGV